jgi:hypothetical protein
MQTRKLVIVDGATGTPEVPDVWLQSGVDYFADAG